ncbi:alpha/beta fold hydrolase [Streptomyces sp. Ac-502]|uniref:alpha/beta fold hydrolase n=1 Tax=Streptomyces sp. Ac-502 TaxID=3342801 RepID=UPI0038624E16
MPVTVLAGENDVVEPPHVLRDCLLPHLPHATLTTVPDAGHLLPVEAPDAVASALQKFLVDTAGGGSRGTDIPG